MFSWLVSTLQPFSSICIHTHHTQTHRYNKVHIFQCESWKLSMRLVFAETIFLISFTLILTSQWRYFLFYVNTCNLAVLVLDTYCVRYPHAVLFLNIFWAFSYSKIFKFAIALNSLKYTLFYSYYTHVLPFLNMPCPVDTGLSHNVIRRLCHVETSYGCLMTF